jgi:hypothetical protein
MRIPRPRTKVEVEREIYERNDNALISPTHASKTITEPSVKIHLGSLWLGNERPRNAVTAVACVASHSSQLVWLLSKWIMERREKSAKFEAESTRKSQY